MRKIVPILFLIVLLILSMALMACSDTELVANAASLPTNTDNLLTNPLPLTSRALNYIGILEPAFNSLVRDFYLYEFKFLIGDDYFVGYSYFSPSFAISELNCYLLLPDNTVSDTSAIIYYISYEQPTNSLRVEIVKDKFAFSGEDVTLVSVVNVSNSQIGNVVTPPDSEPVVPTTFYNYQLQTTKLYLPWFLLAGSSFSHSSLSESFNAAVLNDVPQDMLFKSYTLTLDVFHIKSTQDINITGGTFIDAPVTPLSDDISTTAYIPPGNDYDFLTYAKPTFRGELYSGIYNWLGTGVSPLESGYSNYFVYLVEVDLAKPINLFISVDVPLGDIGETSPYYSFTIKDNYVGLTYDSTKFNPNFPMYSLPFTVVGSSVTDEPLYPYYYGTYTDGFNDGYDKGYIDGSESSSSAAYDRGFYDGRFAGLVEGAETQPYTFMSLMSSVVDAPLKVFRGIFNLDILGINLAGFFLGLLSVAIIITIVRLVI